MSNTKEQIMDFINNKVYMLSTIIIAIITYGYDITHTTIDIDDLEYDRYIGSGNEMIFSGRAGMKLYTYFAGGFEYSFFHSYYFKILSVLFLIASAISFCILFKKISNNKLHPFSYIVFSCFFISYPLLNEIWEYDGANLIVCAGFLIDSLVINLLYGLLNQKTDVKHKKYLYIIISILLMGLVCSSYESMAIVYILGVFCVLFLQALYDYEKKYNLKMQIKNGLLYALILVCGIILRIVVLYGILILYHANKVKGHGSTGIIWLTNPIYPVFRDLLLDIFERYVIVAQWYLPITYFLFSLIFFIIYCLVKGIKLRDKRILIMGLGMILSIFMLSIIQGRVSPYRICQPITLFVALVAMGIFETVAQSNCIYFKKTLAVLLVILCIWQAGYFSRITMINYERSQNEIYTIRDIGTTLASEGICKPIIFTGTYTLPSFITDEISATGSDLFLFNCFNKMVKRNNFNGQYKYVQTNVYSVISWGVRSFDKEGDGIEHIFNFLGYNIKVVKDHSIINLANEIVEKENMPGYPENGYIKDMGDYVIVNFK